MERRNNFLSIALIILTIINILLFSAMWLFFPFAERYYQRYSHVLFVIIAIIITALIIGKSIYSLATKRHNKMALLSVIGWQIIRLLATSEALAFWPGGDDGTKIGWEAFVNLPSWVLAITGIIIFIISYKSLLSKLSE
jgi:hypothetical protein